MGDPGQIVVLNGAPRSGKSSIARAMQEGSDRPWMNLGVDAWGQVIPPRYWPGIGLRPGGGRPDLEPLIAQLYLALYESVAALSRLGLDVVVDVGHHDDYSQPLRILPKVAGTLAGLPALFVGVRCPIDVIMQRRDAGHLGRVGQYATTTPDGSIPEAVLHWQREAHIPGIYDLEVDTSVHSPEACAAVIRHRLDNGPPPTALTQIAQLAEAEHPDE